MKIFTKVFSIAFLFTAVIGLSSFVNPSVSSGKPNFEEFYDVQLLSKTPVGANYEWVWSVTNPNPGNGTDGTLQNLSHWALILPSAVTQANLVGAAYSSDGVNWHELPAVIAVDKSQDCYSNPVMKFDQGFKGGEPMYYKLVVNANYNTGYGYGLFKSGRTTGCFINTVPGISSGGGGGTPNE